MSRLTVLPRSWLFSLLLLLAATPTGAQMIPLIDERENGAHVIYQGDWEDQKASYPPVPFGYWTDVTEALAERYEPCPEDPSQQCLIGSCWGAGFQTSEFLPYGIQFTGGASAGWGIPPSGLWSIISAAGFTFQVDHPFDYNLWIDVDPGDEPGRGRVYFWAYHSTGIVELYTVEAGLSQFTGRLGPGKYKLLGFSQNFNTYETYQGVAYAAQWTIQRPTTPHIAVQPSDRSVGCNGTAVFSVNTTLPQGNYTYQWRRNFVPLTNGPGVTGATTATLTLTSVCTAADYDVVVTGPNPAGGGTIAEPSRLAHLTIATPTGVDVEPSSPTAPAVRAPAPNPFRVSTRMAYEVSRPTRLVATVFNASGARVHSLADRTVSSPGSITWDGRLPSGARAPAGIYFVRVELGEVHRTGKLVLLE